MPTKNLSSKLSSLSLTPKPSLTNLPADILRFHVGRHLDSKNLASAAAASKKTHGAFSGAMKDAARAEFEILAPVLAKLGVTLYFKWAVKTARKLPKSKFTVTTEDNAYPKEVTITGKYLILSATFFANKQTDASIQTLSGDMPLLVVTFNAHYPEDESRSLAVKWEPKLPEDLKTLVKSSVAKVIPSHYAQPVYRAWPVRA